MPSDTDKSTLHPAIPKGRIQGGVIDLLGAAGLGLRSGPRGYRPVPSVPGSEVKLLKPQTIVEMLTAGSRDIGFTGADWVAETDTDAVELLDTRLDPVQTVAAAPEHLLDGGRLPRRPLVIASEYPRLTKRWIDRRDLDAKFVRSYGATEVFPPEDTDVIVDITRPVRRWQRTVWSSSKRSSRRRFASTRARMQRTPPTRRSPSRHSCWACDRSSRHGPGRWSNST